MIKDDVEYIRSCEHDEISNAVIDQDPYQLFQSAAERIVPQKIHSGDDQRYEVVQHRDGIIQPRRQHFTRISWSAISMNNDRCPVEHIGEPFQRN